MARQGKEQVPVTKGKEIQKAPARVLPPLADVERMFDEFFDRGWLPPLRRERPLFSSLSALEARLPKLDIIDRDEEVIVKAEVPGVNKDDIEINLTGNLITIKGESRKEEKEEKGDYYRCEISRGAFSRTATLPAEVDDSKAKATMKDGVLEITLPKVEKAKKRPIKVQ